MIENDRTNQEAGETRRDDDDTFELGASFNGILQASQAVHTLISPQNGAKWKQLFENIMK